MYTFYDDDDVGMARLTSLYASVYFYILNFHSLFIILAKLTAVCV